MTREQIIAVCEMYEEELQDIDDRHVHYVLTMLTRMKCFDDVEKAFRWLGFVQGVLWTKGIYTIDEMRDHNR